MEPQIRFCTSADGTRIAYATLGEGPPLVFVPGTFSHFELEWKHPEGRRAYEGLSLDRRLIRTDPRGIGGSQREVDDLSLQARVADIASVVDHLELEKFDLFGAYDGAFIAITYAAQHSGRVSKLVLWAPYARGRGVSEPGTIRGLAQLMREAWSLGRRALADIAFPTGPTELQRWWSNVLRQSVSPEVAARYLESNTSIDVSLYLSEVTAPALILHRSDDRITPIDLGRAAAALIPDARFVALDGNIGHWMLGDLSYLETVTQFLDEGRAVEPITSTLATEDVHTLLMTDMEGSTSLTQQLGDAKAQEVLRTHNTIIRDALKAHSGSETKHTGDGIMASFASASRALEAAIAMQRAFAEYNQQEPETPIKVRVGLNAGEPVSEEKDLFGTAVQLAARICAQAQPGQILASNVVQELAAGKGFTFADKGEATLKGFEKPVRLHEVVWD